jgi:hypothetical protein
VTPVIRVELPGLERKDRGRDGAFNAIFDRVMANDTICAPER